MFSWDDGGIGAVTVLLRVVRRCTLISLIIRAQYIRVLTSSNTRCHVRKWIIRSASSHICEVNSHNSWAPTEERLTRCAHASVTSV